MAPPRLCASSASRTNSASRSGSAYTATLPMPASLQARTTRTAISPRLATRTFCRGLISGNAAPRAGSFVLGLCWLGGSSGSLGPAPGRLPDEVSPVGSPAGTQSGCRSRRRKAARPPRRASPPERIRTASGAGSRSPPGQRRHMGERGEVQGPARQLHQRAELADHDEAAPAAPRRAGSAGRRPRRPRSLPTSSARPPARRASAAPTSRPTCPASPVATAWAAPDAQPDRDHQHGCSGQGDHQVRQRRTCSAGRRWRAGPRPGPAPRRRASASRRRCRRPSTTTAAMVSSVERNASSRKRDPAEQLDVLPACRCCRAGRRRWRRCCRAADP